MAGPPGSLSCFNVSVAVASAERGNAAAKALSGMVAGNMLLGGSFLQSVAFARRELVLGLSVGATVVQLFSLAAQLKR
jgi:hypothetical protein